MMASDSSGAPQAVVGLGAPQSAVAAAELELLGEEAAASSEQTGGVSYQLQDSLQILQVCTVWPWHGY